MTSRDKMKMQLWCDVYTENLHLKNAEDAANLALSNFDKRFDKPDNYPPKADNVTRLLFDVSDSDMKLSKVADITSDFKDKLIQAIQQRKNKA